MKTPLLPTVAAAFVSGFLGASSALANNAAYSTASLYIENVVFTPASTVTQGNVIASLHATNRGGTTGASLKLKATGLDAGTYTVSTTQASDISKVTLGTFTVTDSRTVSSGSSSSSSASSSSNGSSTTGTTNTPSPDGPRPPPRDHFAGPGVNGDTGGAGAPFDRSASNGLPIAVTFGTGGTAFPDGFNPFDIALVSISDASGNVIFTADFTTVENGSLFYSVPLTAGTDAPSATGVASIMVKFKDGTESGLLSISAANVPASATYTYSIDGTDITTVTTTARGRLRVHAPISTLPTTINLFTITSVIVHDDSGNTVVSASF